MDDEQVTTLMLEALFDIKAAVYDIHELLFSTGDDEHGEQEVGGDHA